MAKRLLYQRKVISYMRGSGEPLFTVSKNFKGADRSIFPELKYLTFLSPGKILYTIGPLIIRFDFETGERVDTLNEENVTNLLIIPNGSIISTDSKRMKEWDQDLNCVQITELDDRPKCLTLLPESRLVVQIGRNLFQIFDVAEHPWTKVDEFDSLADFHTYAYLHRILRLPDNRLLLFIGGTHIRVWDPKSRSFQISRHFDYNENYGSSFTVLPDGHVVFIKNEGRKGNITICDIVSQGTTFVLAELTSNYWSCSPLENSNFAIGVSRKLMIFNSASRECLNVIDTDHLVDQLISLPGNGLISASRVEHIAVWEFKRERMYQLHKARIIQQAHYRRLHGIVEEDSVLKTRGSHEPLPELVGEGAASEDEERREVIKYITTTMPQELFKELDNGMK